jgi:hypothetical protein
VGLLPLLWSFPSSATLTSFPTPGCWEHAQLLTEPLHPTLLVFLQFREGFPFPNLQCSVHTTLFPPCLYCSYCLLLSFTFFPRWGSVSPGSYAVLVQSFLWEYHVLLSSHCSHFPKLSGCRWLAARGPSLFLHLTWSGDVLFSVVLPLWWVSSISPGFHYRTHVFCFSPLAATLESSPTAAIECVFHRILPFLASPFNGSNTHMALMLK